MKYWATEVTAISPKTKKLTTFQGVTIAARTYKEAVQYCNLNGLAYCKVIGEIADDNLSDTPKKEDDVDEIINAYGEVIDPKIITKGMSYDDFIDWLDLGKEEDIKIAIGVFKRSRLLSHVEVMEIYLKNKYGNKKEEETDECKDEDSPRE